MVRRGFFIALEGGEGAGKSTLMPMLADRLRSAGHSVLGTREPGGTQLGERVREILLAERGLDDPLAELLLFEAARAHLVRTIIRPALDRGAVVLCDRFTASSMAYQGYGRGVRLETVAQATAIATGGLEPDLTLLFDLPVDAGLRRRAGAGAANHFEAESLSFHERVRAGFLELAQSASWKVIDAARPLEDVLESAWQEVSKAVGAVA
jgi:dTMP kinase